MKYAARLLFAAGTLTITSAAVVHTATAADPMPTEASSSSSAAAPPAAKIMLGLKLSKVFAAETKISSIDAGSAAARAGLRVGDQVLSINGRVRSRDEVAAALKQNARNGRIITIDRDGKARQLALDPATSAISDEPQIGVTMAGQEETPEIVVSGLVAGGPTDDAGLQLGDRILAVPRSIYLDFD